MKLKLLLASIFCGILSAAAADKVSTDAVTISDIDVAKTDENLFIKMTLDLSGYKGLDTNRDITITPLVVNGTDSLPLHSLAVAGRARYYHWLRRDENDRPFAQLYRAGKDLSVSYSASIPFEKWMTLSSLVIRSESHGCCNEPMASLTIPVTNIDFQPKEKPMFLPMLAFIKPEAEIEKRRELKGSAYIDFPVNRTELYPDYRRNPQELAAIRATIDSVRLDKDVVFKSMTIKGYASPEGSYSNNVRLAKGRTATLKDYILNLYSFPEKIISTSYDPEDWQGLRKYVVNSGLRNREEILAIIDSDMMPDPKNEEIKRRYPEQYKFLLMEVYPGLRHSDYTVEYTVRNYTDIDEIKRLLFTAPQKLSLNEMFAAASSMEPGSPEYNETFMIAVRMFPDSKEANLNAANIALMGHDTETASRYLSKAGDSPEAIYARGVLAGMKGDFEQARKLISEAGQKGVAQAANTLKLIDEITE